MATIRPGQMGRLVNTPSLADGHCAAASRNWHRRMLLRVCTAHHILRRVYTGVCIQEASGTECPEPHGCRVVPTCQRYSCTSHSVLMSGSCSFPMSD
eukprot:6196554-Pleurochrysis_carterae.AAC.6